MQGGAQPKKTLPRPVYEGKADALFKMLKEAMYAGRATRDEPYGTRVVPDITKVRELLDAGIDIRYQVRVSCVCGCDGDRLTRTSEYSTAWKETT